MNARRGLFILCAAAGLLAAPPPARADFRHLHLGARPRAMGSAFVALADDANAAYWNPAGLTGADRLSLMLTRAWLYGVDGLRNDYVCATLPTLGGVRLGASWTRLGLPGLYHEDAVNLAAAAELPWLRGLSAGVTGKLLLLGAPGYERYNDPAYNGGDHALTCDVGLRYAPGGAWTLGAAAYNLTSPRLQLLDTTTATDPAYFEYAVGGSYLFRKTLLVTADVRSREGRSLDTALHGGAEIWFFDALALRAGLDAGQVAMGFGLQDRHWQADFALESNRPLGNVYMLSFTVRN